MFTIKVSYHGQTRKHAFPDTSSFPSYEQICTQLYRVFPIVEGSRNFYFSKLLFSPDSAHLSRILIGREVHTSQDYEQAIKPYKDRTWLHGLLRFTIVEKASTVDANRSLLDSTIPISMSHMPAQPVSSQVQMDVDNSNFRPHNHHRGQSKAQRKAQASVLGSCCSVSQGRVEIQAMINNFQGNLDRVLANNFGTPLTSNSVNTPFYLGTTNNNISAAAPLSLCSVCTRNIGEHAWLSCESCHVVVCESCYNVQRHGFCLSEMGLHKMKRGSMPLRRGPLPVPPFQAYWPHGSESNSPPRASSSPIGPVIHRGVRCDVCNETIQGIRHKCLDCQDYDLCSRCISSGSAEAHNPFHEFFDIVEPGRVIVHNVYSRDGRRSVDSSRTAIPQATAPHDASSSTIHQANCDLCDSQIYGDRYKCLNCPDFDTCSSCFSITNEQHPQHSFVRIKSSGDLIRRPIPIRQMHYATCDGCSKTIHGTRFKCMHSDCPDYDLCDNCESLPIPVHPPNHPMLKMKVQETVIPTVYRVGHTQLIPKISSSVSVGQDTETSPTPALLSMPIPARPSVFVDEERVKTPVPTVHFPSVSTAPLFPPPVPPKPEMVSHSWATIPGLVPSIPWTPEPFFDRYIPSVANPFADIPVPVPPPAPKLTEPVKNETQELKALPTVPDFTPNPWPTTNPDERRELLQLISKFSGPMASAKIISSLTDSPSRKNKKRDPFEESTVANSFDNFSYPEGLPLFSESLLKDTKDKVVEKDDVNKETLSADPTMAVGATSQLFDSMLSNLADEFEQKFKLTSSHLQFEPVVVDKSASIVESSISDEALLNPPLAESPDTISYSPSLVDFPIQEPTSVLTKSHGTPEFKPAPQLPLNATFIEDVTVRDGQVFPPGAEFVKCWRLLNDSGRDWPESTELVFVAGEALSPQKTDSLAVRVGKVSAGAEIDVWTGELKAPDAPGRYVGYWRMKSDGELFGNSLWIEINVVEADSHHSSDESMAASSIIMPSGSPHRSHSVPSATAHSVSAPESISSAMDDNISESGSDISLISMPSSLPSDDEDEELWHDSRSFSPAVLAAASFGGQAPVAPASTTATAAGMDYVLLYDDNSSDDE